MKRPNDEVMIGRLFVGGCREWQIATAMFHCSKPDGPDSSIGQTARREKLRRLDQQLMDTLLRREGSLGRMTLKQISPRINHVSALWMNHENLFQSLLDSLPEGHVLLQCQVIRCQKSFRLQSVLGYSLHLSFRFLSKGHLAWKLLNESCLVLFLLKPT